MNPLGCYLVEGAYRSGQGGGARKREAVVALPTDIGNGTPTQLVKIKLNSPDDAICSRPTNYSGGKHDNESTFTSMNKLTRLLIRFSPGCYLRDDHLSTLKLQQRYCRHFLLCF